MTTQLLGIRIPEELGFQITVQAKARHLSKSEYVRQLLTEGVEHAEEQPHTLKQLRQFRGIVKTDSKLSYDEMRLAALKEKYL